MKGVGEAYAEGRERIIELVRDLSPGDAAARVPTCPAWSIHNVVAHLAGTCADILAGNLDGVATEAWTSAHVEARAERSMAELVDEWTTAAVQVEAFADSFPGRTGAQWVFDMTSHEHDLRCALVRPGARDTDAVMMAVEMLVATGLAAQVTAARLGPLEVKIAEGHTWIVGQGADGAEERTLDDLVTAALVGGENLPVGDGPPVGSLSARAFELMRSLSGRRSLEQVAALEWSVDPTPYLPLLTWGPFTPSGVPIEE